jgi:hypothetical protein
METHAQRAGNFDLVLFSHEMLKPILYSVAWPYSSSPNWS